MNGWAKVCDNEWCMCMRLTNDGEYPPEMYAGADTATHFSFRPGFCTLGTPAEKCTLASGAWQRMALEALDAFMAFIADIRAILRKTATERCTGWCNDNEDLRSWAFVSDIQS